MGKNFEDEGTVIKHPLQLVGINQNPKNILRCPVCGAWYDEVDGCDCELDVYDTGYTD